jgi:hypothetical protein
MAVLYVFPSAEFIQFRDQNNQYITTIHYSELSFGLDANANVQFSHRRESAQIYPIQSAPFAEVLKANGTPYNAVNINAFVTAFTAALPTNIVGGGTDNKKFAWDQMVFDKTTDKAARQITKFDSTLDTFAVSYTTIDGAAYVPADLELITTDILCSFDTAASLNTIKSFTNNFNAGNPQTFTNTVKVVGLQTVVTGAHSIKLVALTSSTFSVNGVTYPKTTASGGIIVDVLLRASAGRTLAQLNYEVLTGTVLETVEV